MAGTAKFELSSVSPEDSGFTGNYPNGRVNYSSRNLDRSGSFREGSEGRTFNSGTGNLKVNVNAVTDFASLPRCLNLEPLTFGDPKYIRAGELRKALSFFYGNVSEDNSFGATHSKPTHAFATDELKHYRASVLEGSVKARNRLKRLDESLNKLSKYSDALNSKKQQTNERSGGSNLMKIGTQSHRSTPELVTQKLEERNKSIALSKRARTPVGDMRAEGRSNGLPRQHLVGKDKDAAKEGSFDLVEQNVRRFPGSEGWDKKMKRKRSMSSVIHRPVDGDGELKRTMHGRLGNDSVIQTSESHGFRSGPSNGVNDVGKLDGTQSSASLSARMMPKSEPEKVSLSRELTGMNKEKLLHKGNTKLNMREDTHLFSPSSVTKGKASRAHRNGTAAVGNTSPSFSRTSATLEDWEQPLNVNKIQSLAGVNNRKRPLPADSSSPPMAQWVQRPQKISRNRRTNIVSPTSNYDEVQMSSEGGASDYGRLPGGINGSLPLKNVISGSQQLKVKFENAPSPARLSEGEENSAVDNRLKDKSLGGSEVDQRGINGHQHGSPSGLFKKKNKLVGKEEIGDGVRRQGRTGRVSTFPRGSMSPLRDKLENPGAAKPVRSSRPGSEKNGSKSGRPPLKKQSERKGFTRLGTVSNSSSPDFTGESDDDYEELLQAAQFACNASYNGCSSLFWKRLEQIFYMRPEDNSFLEEQLKLVEEHEPSLNELPSLGEHNANHALHIAHSESPTFVSGDNQKCVLDNGLVGSAKIGNLLHQFQDLDSSYKGLDAEKGPNGLTPLYRRVLSALIVEDEFEEFEDNNFGGNCASLSNRNDPFSVLDRISCNGTATHSRFSGFPVPVHEEMEDVNYSYAHELGQASPAPFQGDTNGSLAMLTNSSGDSYLECQYGQMCMDDKLLIELRSIGLHPEAVPDLAEGEDELINPDIVQLKKQLSLQAGKKKVYLDRLHKAIGERTEVKGRELEQLAINRLTELAYRKLLATRGSSASRIGISKVSRHVALAFIKRTLARCRQFEDAGKSCFTEPAFRDALLAVPINNAGTGNCFSSAELNTSADARTSGSEQPDLQNKKSERGSFDGYYETHSHFSDNAFAKNGPMLSRGRKKEALLDDVGANAPMRSTSNLGSTFMGGTKGKRSERDSSAKAGRLSLANSKGERRTKAKPKQKAGPMSTHPVQPSIIVSSELASGGSNRKREGLISPGNIVDSSKENNSLGLGNLHELDSIEDLNVENEFGGHQDLSSWLNFDEVDGLQDHDSMGLEIPMDDLSDLQMLL